LGAARKSSILGVDSELPCPRVKTKVGARVAVSLGLGSTDGISEALGEGVAVELGIGVNRSVAVVVGLWDWVTVVLSEIVIEAVMVRVAVEVAIAVCVRLGLAS
jgi:hypothetical protein